MAEVEEYEKGYGSGPFGTREVNLCSIRFNPLVSILAAIWLWGFVIYAVTDEDSSVVFGEWKTYVTDKFTWLYIISQDYWLVYLFPLVYYYGDMKLGKDDEEPEYGDLTYLAMVWCAGVAIGLIFYGASEPLFHATDGTNRYNNDGYSNDNQKALYGLHITMFHWGFMAWIVYCLTALTMGFLSYRRGLPLCFRTTLAPVLGKATWGWLGDLLDIVTIVTIVAGLTTSLGLGAKQIVEGCRRLGWLPAELTEDELTTSACWIIGIVTVCATASVVAGLEFGIKSVSYVAFMLGNFLILVVFCLDETWYILNVLVSTLGFHLQYFIETAFDTDAFAQLGPGNGQPNDGKGANPSWMDWWTIFYWGWWIAWAPFVGTFMARVSRGRTIRQVVLYTLTIPCGYAFIWFCTFGAAAIRMDRRATYLANYGLTNYGNADYFLATSEHFRPSGAGKCYNVPATLPGDITLNPYVSPVCNFASADSNGYWFDLMGQYYGMGQFLTFISIVTTVLYFVTSSDSGSLVVDLIAANGREAHVIQRVFWAVTEGAVAIATVASGGFDSLSGLQAVSIVMGLPFTFILMVMCTSLWRALKLEAGDMPPVNKRTDWTLPLYGGIFDLPEVVLSCRRCPMPPMKSICDFFTALFFPGYSLYKALKGLAQHQEKPMQKAVQFILAKLTQFLFMAFVALQIASVVYWNMDEGGGLTGRGMYAFSWICYIAMTGFVALGRHLIRRLYSIEGSGMEDWWACLFLYPQALAQMVSQIDSKPVPQTYEKPQKGFQAVIGKEVDI